MQEYGGVEVWRRQERTEVEVEVEGGMEGREGKIPANVQVVVAEKQGGGVGGG